MWIFRETLPGPGLRVAIKDLIDVAGLPTTAGSRAVAEQAGLAAQDAACLSGLRAAEEKLKKDNKSLVIFWMGGGPSHMDLWDLKPGNQNGGGASRP